MAFRLLSFQAGISRCRGSGKYNGNYYLGFRILGVSWSQDNVQEHGIYHIISARSVLQIRLADRDTVLVLSHAPTCNHREACVGRLLQAVRKGCVEGFLSHWEHFLAAVSTGRARARAKDRDCDPASKHILRIVCIPLLSLQGMSSKRPCCSVTMCQCIVATCTRDLFEESCAQGRLKNLHHWT